MTKCYLFDIDGTIANIDHRLHHIQKEPADWNAFYTACPGESPIAHILDVAHALSHDVDIVFITGRSETCRRATLDWLKANLPNCGLEWEFSEDGARDLYMRADGD